MTKTPDDIVAEQIVAELYEQQLVSEAKLKDLAKKLSMGTLSPQDWRLLVELEVATEAEAGDGQEN